MNQQIRANSKHLKKAFELGDTDAQAEMGKYYIMLAESHYGNRYVSTADEKLQVFDDSDYQKGLKMISEAADKGSGRAYMLLHDVYKGLEDVMPEYADKTQQALRQPAACDALI